MAIDMNYGSILKIITVKGFIQNSGFFALCKGIHNRCGKISRSRNEVDYFHLNKSTSKKVCLKMFYSTVTDLAKLRG